MVFLNLCLTVTNIITGPSGGNGGLGNLGGGNNMGSGFNNNMNSLDALSQAYSGIQQYAGLSSLVNQGNASFLLTTVCGALEAPASVCTSSSLPHPLVSLSTRQSVCCCVRMYI